MSSANPAIICVAVQLVLATVLVFGEVSGRLRLPYSKFGTGRRRQFPNRIGARLYNAGNHLHGVLD